MNAVEELAKSPDGNCQLCAGSGVMSWEQPMPDGVLRTIEMACPNGCSGHWKHPHAERDRVIEQQPDDRPQRVRGWADESQEIGAGFIQAALRNWGFEQPKD